jgi:hypothetical protein
LAERGRRAEDGDLLAPVSGWFTERLDTADREDAEALLADILSLIAQLRAPPASA